MRLLAIVVCAAGCGVLSPVWIRGVGSSPKPPAAQTGRQGTTGQSLPGQTPVNTMKAELDRWMKELSNWGRWGKDDQRGTLNLITDAKRASAAALARTGASVSLAHDILTIRATNTNQGFVLKPSVFTRGVATDKLEIEAHNGTHLDALCHVAWDSALYNGLAFKDVAKVPEGCGRAGVTMLKDGLVTRGVLIDIPRLKGVPYLAPGTHVYREDIEAWEKESGVRIGPGDAIFLRTGRWAPRPNNDAGAGSGYDASFLPFLKERDVALLSSDGVHEVGWVPGCPETIDNEDPLAGSMCRIPVHKFAIAARGMYLSDNADLDAAAETAARLKRWEFMLVVAPLRVHNGTGSPVNPIAMF